MFADSTYNDSISALKKIAFNGFVASSFLINSDWKEMNNTSILLSGSVNYENICKAGDKKRIYEMRGELSYTKLIDSIWIKTTDNIFLSYILISQGRKKIKRSLSVNLKSQFTNSWENPDPAKSMNRKWKSGPLIPANLVFGYGLNYSWPNESYIDASLISAKVRTSPITELSTFEKFHFAKTEKIVFESQVGLNIQAVLNSRLSKKLRWENRFSLFIPEMGKKTILFEMQNSFVYRISRSVRIKSENKFLYDSDLSTKMQMRYELLIGYGFGK